MALGISRACWTQPRRSWSSEDGASWNSVSLKRPTCAVSSALVRACRSNASAPTCRVSPEQPSSTESGRRARARYNRAMADCIFCKIVAGEIPSTRVYEDDDLVAFEDLNPQAPLHALIVPRRHISTLNDLTAGDDVLAGSMVRAAAS